MNNAVYKNRLWMRISWTQNKGNVKESLVDADKLDAE